MSVVVWFTGLSGSGKSTIAARVARTLREGGRRVEYLDGDVLRAEFPTGFSKAERDEHVRRVGFMASRLAAHGVIVVASFVSPFREARDFVRSLCPLFMEVYVSTSLEECERRDAKGLYARARAGQIPNFTGINDPYEAPEHPELTIDTEQVPLEESVRRITTMVEQRMGGTA